MEFKKTSRKIDWIVIHCTATREGQDISVDQIRKWHTDKGWSDIGYHFVIDLQGNIHKGRPVSKAGAHVRGFNSKSIAISYVGGVDKDLKAKDTRTTEQKEAICSLLTDLKTQYRDAKIVGHRDFSKDKNNDGIITPSEWMKMCPSYDVQSEYNYM